MGKLCHTSLESSNMLFDFYKAKPVVWPTVLDTTLPAIALCSVPALVGSCSPCAQDGRASHGVLCALPANTAIPGLKNPAPPILWYQPSSLTFFISLLWTSASLCFFIFKGHDQCWSCFPQIPMMLIFFSLQGVPCLICSRPSIWRGGEGISLFSFDLFSWSLWQLMVILKLNISRN